MNKPQSWSSFLSGFVYGFMGGVLLWLVVDVSTESDLACRVLCADRGGTLLSAASSACLCEAPGGGFVVVERRKP